VCKASAQATAQRSQGKSAAFELISGLAVDDTGILNHGFIKHGTLLRSESGAMLPYRPLKNWRCAPCKMGSPSDAREMVLYKNFGAMQRQPVRGLIYARESWAERWIVGRRCRSRIDSGEPSKILLRIIASGISDEAVRSCMAARDLLPLLPTSIN
jgi:hypothetical protein